MKSYRLLFPFVSADSVIGRYDELLYSAGLYTDPATCSKKALASIDRIWVDSKLSQRAGRNIWSVQQHTCHPWLMTYQDLVT